MILTFQTYTQNEGVVLGLTFGSLHASDARLFNNPDLNQAPLNVFTKIGFGAKFSNNVTVTTNVVLDLWYFETSVFIPMYAIKPKHKGCNYAILNNRL